jgi:uncharacterized integral membrane protein
MLFLYVVIGILGAATLIFTVQNPDPVAVRFLDWRTGTFPLSFVLLLAVFLGLVVASISAFAQQIHLERKIRQLRHQVSDLMAFHARESSRASVGTPGLREAGGSPTWAESHAAGVSPQPPASGASGELRRRAS